MTLGVAVLVLLVLWLAFRRPSSSGSDNRSFDNNSASSGFNHSNGVNDPNRYRHPLPEPPETLSRYHRRDWEREARHIDRHNRSVDRRRSTRATMITIGVIVGVIWCGLSLLGVL
jgi:hypothetical protein